MLAGFGSLGVKHRRGDPGVGASEAMSCNHRGGSGVVIQ